MDYVAGPCPICGGELQIKKINHSLHAERHGVGFGSTVRFYQTGEIFTSVWMCMGGCEVTIEGPHPPKQVAVHPAPLAPPPIDENDAKVLAGKAEHAKAALEDCDG